MGSWYESELFFGSGDETTLSGDEEEEDDESLTGEDPPAPQGVRIGGDWCEEGDDHVRCVVGGKCALPKLAD